MRPPADVRAAYKAAPHLTHVELTWREGRIEHWLRFGHPVAQQRLDALRKIASFAPGSVFCFVRWASNAYGTVISRIDIVRVIEPGQAYQTVPFVRRGGEAFGDAVVPQIPEVIGRAILRTEMALNSVYGAFAPSISDPEHDASDEGDPDHGDAP